jgi:adenosine kinase
MLQAFRRTHQRCFGVIATVAQWVSGKPGLTVYSGCVGDDEYGRRLEAAARKDNVRVEYLKDATHPTGTCAVLIHEKERSLVANLGAANHYKISHLESPLMQAVVAQARIFYSAGFFLTVSPDSMVAVGKHAAETGKIYMTNLSGEWRQCVCFPILFGADRLVSGCSPIPSKVFR